MGQGTTFVLVHGAWHGAWCYSRVAERLSLRGHRVFTPTLTGVGDRSHLYSPAINLTTHVLDVINLIRWHELRDIVLVGHSYGGMVVTAVADQLPEQIAALVYLDAFLPQNGQCLHDLAPPDMVRAQVESATAANHYAVPPIPAAVFNVNPADREWVDRLCTPQPLATFTEPVKLTGRAHTVPRKAYVLAGDFPLSVFGQFRDPLAKRADWQTHELHCGHDVMIDMPEETAEIIAGT
jgi:pimeloyl-ACP methyl ester carboxylesterase